MSDTHDNQQNLSTKFKSQRKGNFISLYPLKKGLNWALLATKFGVRIIEVQIIEVRIIEDALYSQTILKGDHITYKHNNGDNYITYISVITNPYFYLRFLNSQKPK